MNIRTITLYVVLASLLAACGGSSQPTADPNVIMTVAFATVNASGTQTALAVPTNTPTATPPPTPTFPPQPTEFVPASFFPATVNTAVAYCRFGPNTVYVAKFGLRFGAGLEAIGRTELGDWLFVRNPGGAKGCWVSTSLLSLQGDVSTLAVAPIVWVSTDKYPPPADAKAVRSGDQVVITWSAVTVVPRDTYYEGPYLLEAWVCSGGQIVRQLVGSTELTLTVVDQAGCAEPSKGLLYTATREGYSAPATITWPAH